MYDKLSIVNTCLALTGNSTVNAEEDGSPEWAVASLAYEAAVKYLLASHTWKFDTAHVDLTRLSDSDEDDYEDVYAKPVNCLGLEWVKQNGCPIDHKIVGNNVYLTRIDQSAPVKAKVVLRGDPSEWNPLFVQALFALVRSGIYRGLNEDPTEANNEEQKADEYLALARSRTDREDKPRPVFRSRMLARRRGRAGWIRTYR